MVVMRRRSSGPQLHSAQQGAVAPGTAGSAAQTPRAAAPIDLTGYWVSIVNEDWRWRMVTPPKGDFASVPLNPRGRRSPTRGTRPPTARASPTAPPG